MTFRNINKFLLPVTLLFSFFIVSPVFGQLGGDQQEFIPPDPPQQQQDQVADERNQFERRLTDVVGTTTAFQAGPQRTSIPETVGNIIRPILTLTGVVLVVIIIYAGFLWLTAGGNAEQVKKAKQWLINAVIGMVIVFSAYAITGFVINALI